VDAKQRQRNSHGSYHVILRKKSVTLTTSCDPLAATLETRWHCQPQDLRTLEG